MFYNNCTLLHNKDKQFNPDKQQNQGLHLNILPLSFFNIDFLQINRSVEFVQAGFPLMYSIYNMGSDIYM